METKLHAAQQIAAQLRPTVDARASLLQSLDDRQAAYTRDRQDRCDWFEAKSAGQIRASVAAGFNRELFHSRLSELKRGSRRRDVEIRAIVDSSTPREFVTALLRFDHSRDSRHLAGIAEASGLNIETILVLAEFLLSDDGNTTYEQLLELQYAATPADRPTIAFRREDGSYAPLADLSTGQKCTALLVMALCEGDSPIVVDQPEDSLDIRSIWRDMCERLRVSKRTRQFVFTTHNSSLAVASVSDMLVVMAADARRGEAILSGAIDTERVRREVISLLEGGDTTYFLKQRKYDLRDPYAARPSRNGA